MTSNLLDSLAIGELTSRIPSLFLGRLLPSTKGTRPWLPGRHIASGGIWAKLGGGLDFGWSLAERKLAAT